jgi:hypothetical protein
MIPASTSAFASTASTPPLRPRRTDPERCAPERAGPKRHQVRLRCVQAGKETFPYLGDVTPEAVEFYHHGSRQSIPMPLEQLIRAAAAVGECSPTQILQYIAEKIEAADCADTDPNLTLSGPSAPTPETSDAQPRGGRNERLR